MATAPSFANPAGNHMFLNRFARVIVIISLLCTSLQAKANNFELTVKNGMVRLHAHDASLLHILKEIEEETEITMQLIIDEKSRVTGKLEQVPLNEALCMLMRNLNFFIVYTGKDEEEDLITAILAIDRFQSNNDTTVIKSSYKASSHMEEGEYEKPIEIFESVSGGSIPLYNTTPIENDPMVSMNGIDPLMRSVGNRPEFLPIISVQ